MNTNINTKESSLTAPEDRDQVNKWRPNQGERKLENKEVTEAMNELYVSSFTEKFLKVDRVYSDPPIPGQTYCLISFIPAKGAQANEHDVYGYIKVRGVYNNMMECETKVEEIIRNVDSYHPIQTGFIGRPLPLTTSTKYSAETSEIDIRKQMTDSISDSVKRKKDQEKQQVKEVEDRQQALQEESRRAQKGEEEPVDPLDLYITLSVKKAQLSWNYLEHRKKMKELEDIITDSRKRLVEMDVSDPSLREKYMKKYRKSAGISEMPKDASDNFIKYMGEDVDLGF
jgi:Family of unknown function (DUF5832)